MLYLKCPWTLRWKHRLGSWIHDVDGTHVYIRHVFSSDQNTVKCKWNQGSRWDMSEPTTHGKREEEKIKNKKTQKILISLVTGLSKGYMKKDFTSSPRWSLFLFLLPYQSLHTSFGTIRVVMCLGLQRKQPVSKINMERGSQMSKYWAKWCCR